MIEEKSFYLADQATYDHHYQDHHHEECVVVLLAHNQITPADRSN